MFRAAYTIAMLLIVRTALSATTIEINLGPPAIYTNTQLGPISFSDLNGTAVNGSTLSLDFFFPSTEFVELFPNTTSSFEIGVNLHTNAGTFPGVVTNASADLVDQNGTAIPRVSLIGRSDSSSGVTSFGFFPLLPPNTTLSSPLDFYGVDFTFTLPNDPSVNIVGADFTLFGQGGSSSQFEVGPHVPDSGNTLQLLMLAVLGLFLLKRPKFIRR